MLTVEEKHLKQLLKLWVLVYFGMGIFLLLAPDQPIRVLNLFSMRWFPRLALLPDTGDRFFLLPVVSLEFTLAFICYIAQTAIRRDKRMVIFFLFNRAVFTALLISFFLFYVHAFGYLLVGILEGTILMLTWIAYSRANRSHQLW